MSRKLKISLAPSNKQLHLPAKASVEKSIRSILEKFVGVAGLSRLSWFVEEVKWGDGDGKTVEVSLGFQEPDRRSMSRFLFSLGQLRIVEDQKVVCRVVDCDGF